MIRILTAAAVAALIASTASAQTIRITTAGKSAEQVNTEIRAAAKAVCAETYASIPVPLEITSACVRSHIVNAKAQLAGAPYAALTPASIQR